MRGQSEDGWVRIPNKGRIPWEMGDGLDAFGRPTRRGSEPASDLGIGPDRSIGPEPGSSVSVPGDTDARGIEASASSRTGLRLSIPGVGRPEGTRADEGSSRVEASLHVVDRGENFWTISRLYYGDGRYYRALWKANSRNYANVKEIHINDVILIPAVEDLDPAYIGPLRRRQSAGRDEGATRDEIAGSAEVAPAGTDRPNSFPTTRTARISDTSGGNAVRRDSRVESELELPVAGAEDVPARGRRRSSGNRPGEEEDDAPATRLSTRPQDPAPVDRPVYKVRRHDTLRSIARDLLGDSHRANEIYDINRDVIADPTRLTPGQLLELPEDADTRRVTSRDRHPGRDQNQNK
jgi:nucleoid-associated protein YgaU